jgi:ribonuclease HI
VPPERVVVHVDGGARGNPGPAGVGVVATDVGGRELARANDFLGVATNNAAEYRAVLLGLDVAHALGAREVEIVNDSELVARQLAGDYRVKSADLKPLYEAARKRLEQFGRWSIRSVPRERNETADTLVNEAIDAGSATIGNR